MKLSEVLKACTLLVLICAPRLVYGQASTSPTPGPRPGNLLQQNLVSPPTTQPLSTPLRSDAIKSNDPKRQALTRKLERRRIELQERREERVTAPVQTAAAKKN